MTSVIRDLAHEYRQRAEEVRVKAEAATDDFSRKSLLQIADTLERMAQYEEGTNPQAHLWKEPSGTKVGRWRQQDDGPSGLPDRVPQ